MTTKTKGRDGGNHATRKTTHRQNHKSIAARLKAVIVTLALWGVLPVNLAEWIILRLHLRDA